MNLQSCIDSFDANIPAQLLLCAAAKDVGDAYVVLTTRLRDDTWRHAPLEFVECLAALCARGERVQALVQLGEGVFRKLPTVSFEHDAWNVVPRAIVTADMSAKWAEPIADAVIQSLPKMGAGQGKLVCTIAEAALARVPFGDADDVLMPVVPASLLWLLEKGSAELRGPEHASLLSRALLAIATGALDNFDHEHLGLLARFVLQHPAAFSNFARGPDFSQVVGSLQSRGNSVLASEFLQVATERELLTQALDGSSVELRPQLESLWRDSVATGSVDLPANLVERFMLALPKANPTAVFCAQAMQAVLDQLVPIGVRDDWVVYLTSAAPNFLALTEAGMNLEWARMQAAVLQQHSSPEVAHRILKVLLIGSKFRSAALKAALDAQEAGALLPTKNSLTALLELWLEEMASCVRDPAINQDKYDVFTRAIDRLIGFAWGAPVFGVPVSDMFGTVRSCELVSLSHGDLVRVDQRRRVVQLDSGYVDLVSGDSSLQGQEQVALVCLYFLHEYIHHVQHVATKEQVAQLRTTGAEATLMHIDLGADHAATVIAHTVFQAWTLPMLKELQARSLTDFPTSPQYPRAAKWRKAIRRASIMADAIYLRGGGISSGSYRYVEFGALGGRFALLDSGPPVRVIGDCPATPHDISLLETCADPGAEAPDRLASFAKDVSALVGRCVDR